MGQGPARPYVPQSTTNNKSTDHSHKKKYNTTIIPEVWVWKAVQGFVHQQHNLTALDAKASSRKPLKPQPQTVSRWIVGQCGVTGVTKHMCLQRDTKSTEACILGMPVHTSCNYGTESPQKTHEYSHVSTNSNQYPYLHKGLYEAADLVKTTRLKPLHLDTRNLWPVACTPAAASEKMPKRACSRIEFLHSRPFLLRL